jgi:hypothetical protein
MKLKIISDGTNAGTKLIDEDSGEMIHLIQKLTWECNAKDHSTKVNIELLNIPVEIVSKAEVDLLEFKKENSYQKPIHTKFLKRKIKIVSEDGKGYSSFVKIFDAETNEPVSAVQEVKWKATPKGSKAKVKKIKFDKKDW